MSDNNHDKYIDIDIFNPDNHIKTESPLIYHVYNNKRIKSFQNYLPFFYRIYNISAMKMHQMATKLGMLFVVFLLLQLYSKVILKNQNAIKI